MLVGVQTALAASQRPSLLVERLPDCAHVVSFESELVPGWNKPVTQVRFVLPLPYPAAQPDCFYADIDLRLASGAMPGSSGIQALNGVSLLWFSWHLTAWHPQRDNVLTYVRFVESRLHDPR